MSEEIKHSNLNGKSNENKEVIKNSLGQITISKTKRFEIVNKKKDDTKILDEELEKTIAIYNKEYSYLNDYGIELFYLRNKTIDLIDNIEYLINSIVNHPKEFDKEISDINIIKNNFRQTCDFAKEELETIQKSALTAGVGVTGGLAILNLAPGAAMWVATTFGTASTGTAISTLSGAAATNAALAWLGGGSLAANGAGIVGGKALLAMAGPIGLSIAGVSLLTSIIIINLNKGKIKKEKKEEIEKIKINTQKILKISQELKVIMEENKALYLNLLNNFKKALYIFNTDYKTISDEEKFLLGSIVNETKAIAKSIEKGIKENE